MNRGFALFLLVGAAAMTAAFSALGEKGGRSVQIVYESDTRGYYLPCG